MKQDINEKKTKIICTVGPSTDVPDILEKMLTAGMNVARFNFSHGSQAEHAKHIEMVRATSRLVALMLDTKGPEMRLGKFSEGKGYLREGQSFILTTKELLGTSDIASVNHSNLHNEVNPGKYYFAGRRTYKLAG